MFSTFPNDVFVLGSSSLTLARFQKRGKQREIVQVQRLSVDGIFTPAVVTPLLTDPQRLSETVRRLRLGAGGRIERAALLLPDSWFRMNLIELDNMPSGRSEANEMVRWALKRTLPIAPDQLRLAWMPVSRTGTKRKVLVVSAVEKSIAAIEAALRAAGIQPSMIEPLGLNLWNAITAGETALTGDRVMFHISDQEFTTALFRGAEPLFLRSRPMSGERSVAGEIRLTASFLRENHQLDTLETCHLAFDGADQNLTEVIRNEFGGNVSRVEAGRYLAIHPDVDVSGIEAEMIACSGVFTS
jgi:Tfp pilus assembly PilM family ATPase